MRSAADLCALGSICGVGLGLIDDVAPEGTDCFDSVQSSRRACVGRFAAIAQLR